MTSSPPWKGEDSSRDLRSRCRLAVHSRALVRKKAPRLEGPGIRAEALVTGGQEAVAARGRPASGAPARGPGPVRLFRFLIYGLVLASSATQFAVVPILPVYAHRLGLSGLQQGMVLGATGLATLAVSLPAGILSDRLGARRLTLWAGWLMSVALLAQAMAGSFPVLLAARLGFGIGFAVVWTAGLSWLAGAAPGGPGLGGTVASAGAAAWSGRPCQGWPSSTSAW